MEARSKAADIASAAMAQNTVKSYSKCWQEFRRWCAAHDVAPLKASPEQVMDYLMDAATNPRPSTGKPLSVGSVQLLSCAINKHYWLEGLTSPTHSPTVVNFLKGLDRLHGRRPRQVRALREHDMERMLEACPQGLTGLRDRAILALGFAAALRRSEIVALRVDDLHTVDTAAGKPRYRSDGTGSVQQVGGGKRLLLTIRKSKTDQAGKGYRIPVMDGQRIRPVTHVRAWLAASGIKDGFLFRSLRRGGNLRGPQMHHSDISRIVKQYAKAVGLPAADYSAHSLRAGFITCAAAAGARLDKIMEVSRHTNPQTVMKYIRDADVFTDHAGEAFL